MSAGWGCPHKANNKYQRVENRPYDLNMKDCILAGRFVFSDDSKNTKNAIKKKKPSDKEE